MQVGLPCPSGDLPFYYSITKLHKTPVAARFIAGHSREVTTTGLNKVLASFFRGVNSNVEKLWCAAVEDIPGFEETPWPWLLTNTADIIPRIQAFNRSNYLQPVRQVTADFKRLYTNLPIPDLRGSLHWLMQEVAAFHGGAVAVKIWADQKKALEWYRAGEVPDQRQGRLGGIKFKIYELWLLAQGLGWLLDNTFIVFGGRVYKQVVGIPMGGNAAVFIANYFLLVAELRFMRRLAAAIERHPPGQLAQQYTSVEQLLHPVGAVHPGRAALFIARSFQYSSRFVDDLHTISNPLLAHLTYTNQVLGGIRGIYAPSLDLEVTAEGSAVPFLDIEILPAHSNECCPLSTKLYDKRRRAEFRAVQIVRFLTSLPTCRCAANTTLSSASSTASGASS